MARRSATTLLLIAYLASQMAAVPHAHGADCENQPADHDARPHFHISSAAQVGHSHPHADVHQHPHDHAELHHHEDKSNSVPANTFAAKNEQREHESNAVYFSEDFGVALHSKNIAPANNLDSVSSLAVVAIVARTNCRNNSAE